MSWLAWMRGVFYHSRLKKVIELPAFTISVGNLSMGGTGKSPLVSILAKFFLEKKIATALLSRGYGRKSKEGIILHAQEALPSALDIGDEPWMIREENPGLALVIHPKRGVLAFKKWRELGSPQLIILDDAFQHWQVARDFDVVMIDATESLDQASLPFGRLRESIRALRRADLVVITRAKEAKNIALLRERLRLYLHGNRKSVPWRRKRRITRPAELLECSYEFVAFRDLSTKAIRTDLNTKEIVLLSGIAKPESFARLVQEQGLKIREKIYLADHAAWNTSIENKLRAILEKNPDSCLVCTQKDWARWKEALQGLPIQAVYAEVALRFTPESEARMISILSEITACII